MVTHLPSPHFSGQTLIFENEQKASKAPEETINTNENENAVTDENLTSTQNMINDSRKRRKLNGKEINCNICAYKTKSMALLKAHKKNCQNQTDNTANKINCEKCDFRATDKTTLQRHVESVHEEICHGCDKCDYKATDNTTL